MSCLQINLHCSRATQDLLHQAIAEQATEYIFVSEFHSLGGHNWFPDANGKAAIVYNSKFPIDIIGPCEAGFRWIETGGMRLLSCNWSPNTTHTQYTNCIDRLESSIRNSPNPVVVAGDFNAWYTIWGSRKNNNRGEALYDMIVGANLVICNQEKTPTFECRGRQSIIATTMASVGIATKIIRWRVVEKPSLSDHNYISFNLEDLGNPADTTNRSDKWKINYDQLRDMLKSTETWEEQELELEDSEESFSKKIREGCGEYISHR